MVMPVDISGSWIDVLFNSRFLKQHQTADRATVGETCLPALVQRAVAHRPQIGNRKMLSRAHGLGPQISRPEKTSSPHDPGFRAPRSRTTGYGAGFSLVVSSNYLTGELHNISNTFSIGSLLLL